MDKVFSKSPGGLLHTLPCLHASGLFLGQSGLDFMPQEGCGSSTAGCQEEKGEAGHVDRQRSVALQEDLLPPLVIQEDGLQLGECADGQKCMKDLVPMAHDVTGTRKILLRYRAGKEVGADQKEEDLEGVVPGRLFLAAG